MQDKKLLKWVFIILMTPLVLAYFSNGGESFRYPCQNPENWDKPMCQLPTCDVTRTCPAHIFKGQRDPRLGMTDDKTNTQISTPAPAGSSTQGANCGK